MSAIPLMRWTAAPCATGEERAKVAIIPWDRLGDGVIFLVIAENFRRAGYRVSYYSNTLYQMRHWLPQLEILPAPQPDQLDDILSRHDVVLNDFCSPLSAGLPDRQREAVARKTVTLSTNLRLPDHWQLPPLPKPTPAVLEQHPELEQVLASDGMIRGEKTGGRSMVDFAVEYCRDRCGLPASSEEVAFTPPAGLQKAQHPRRVVIFPTTDAKKQYPAARFLKVAAILQGHGCDVEFVVMPEHLQRWRQLSSQWPVHAFEAIGDLAAFIYESGATLCNDCGGGHLSSLIGIPTVTIYRKRDYFEYRPGWGKGAVVRPLIVPKLLGKRVWKPFLPASLPARACLAVLDSRDS